METKKVVMDNPIKSKKGFLFLKKKLCQVFNIEELNLIFKNPLIMKP